MKFATIFKEDLEYISRCMLDYPNIETGGDFFGFWNNLGLPVIQYVTGQGRNSNQQSTFFQQDVDYLLKVSNAAYHSFGLQHIGSWHSHHKLGLARPSGHDAQTMANAINKNGLNQFFMILGNIQNDRTAINGFLFDKENQRNYFEMQWNILYEKNTFKETIDNLVGKDLYIPQTAKAKFADLKLINATKTETIVLDSAPDILDKERKKERELQQPAIKQITESQGEEEQQVAENNNVASKKNPLLENEQNKKKLKSFMLKLEQKIKTYPFLSVIISALIATLLSASIIKGIDVTAKFIWKITEICVTKKPQV